MPPPPPFQSPALTIDLASPTSLSLAHTPLYIALHALLRDAHNAINAHFFYDPAATLTLRHQGLTVSIEKHPVTSESALTPAPTPRRTESRKMAKIRERFGLGLEGVRMPASMLGSGNRKASIADEVFGAKHAVDEKKENEERGIEQDRLPAAKRVRRV